MTGDLASFTDIITILPGFTMGSSWDLTQKFERQTFTFGRYLFNYLFDHHRIRRYVNPFVYEADMCKKSQVQACIVVSGGNNNQTFAKTRSVVGVGIPRTTPWSE